METAMAESMFNDIDRSDGKKHILATLSEDPCDSLSKSVKATILFYRELQDSFNSMKCANVNYGEKEASDDSMTTMDLESMKRARHAALMRLRRAIAKRTETPEQAAKRRQQGRLRSQKARQRRRLAVHRFCEKNDAAATTIKAHKKEAMNEKENQLELRSDTLNKPCSTLKRIYQYQGNVDHGDRRVKGDANTCEMAAVVKMERHDSDSEEFIMECNAGETPAIDSVDPLQIKEIIKVECSNNEDDMTAHGATDLGNFNGTQLRRYDESFCADVKPTFEGPLTLESQRRTANGSTKWSMPAAALHRSCILSDSTSCSSAEKDILKRALQAERMRQYRARRKLLETPEEALKRRESQRLRAERARRKKRTVHSEHVARGDNATFKGAEDAAQRPEDWSRTNIRTTLKGDTKDKKWECDCDEAAASAQSRARQTGRGTRQGRHRRHAVASHNEPCDLLSPRKCLADRIQLRRSNESADQTEARRLRQRIYHMKMRLESQLRLSEDKVSAINEQKATEICKSMQQKRINELPEAATQQRQKRTLQVGEPWAHPETVEITEETATRKRNKRQNFHRRRAKDAPDKISHAL